MFAIEMERRPAGDQDLEAAALGQQCADKRCGRQICSKLSSKQLAVARASSPKGPPARIARRLTPINAGQPPHTWSGSAMGASATK